MGTWQCIYEIAGTVQGVGFRPSVFRLATAAMLGGWIQNRSGTVRLCLQGQEEQVETFIRNLPSRLPSAASIDSISIVSRMPWESSEESRRFAIVDSQADEDSRVAIPADQVMCDSCRFEVFDPANRRFRYPFTTCTDCGPRLTVVESVPYDRERTTLRHFPLCPACRAEYESPANRRFHAESIACPDCGPRLTFESLRGDLPVQQDPIMAARAALAEGRIVALRGLGGFHLACDATQVDTVRRLRERKSRPDKPLAVMARSLEVARRYVEVSAAAARVLCRSEAPIVLLPWRTGGSDDMRALLAPDTSRVGVMLPTTPLHALLFRPTLAEDRVAAFDLLVMTSGNHRGEPIAIANDEARLRLDGIADLLLVHDRKIAIRSDDSVVALQGEEPQVWRRSRGYAPLPLRVIRPFVRPVLAAGADMKNAIALGTGSAMILSPHIGDLEEPEAISHFEGALNWLPRHFDTRPEVVAVDMHPDMVSSRLASDYARENSLPVHAIQHHEAHAAACLGEHRLESGLALVFDGTGLGRDGSLWGAELFLWEEGRMRRLATFAPVALPGGEAAIRNPVRQLIARWHEAGVQCDPAWMQCLGVRHEQIEVWQHQCESGLFTVKTHAAGRLFDSVSALLGVAPSLTTYEGQPAIRLEQLAEGGRTGATHAFPYTVSMREDLCVIDWNPTFREFTRPLEPDTDRATLARGFHEAIADAATCMVEYGLEFTGQRYLGLGGGVFMNRLLNQELETRLTRLGVEVIRNKRVPPNDGGIAVGQAILVNQTLKEGR